MHQQHDEAAEQEVENAINGKWHLVHDHLKESRLFVNAIARSSFKSINKAHPHVDWLEADTLFNIVQGLGQNSRYLLSRLPQRMRTLALCVEVRKLCGEYAIPSIPPRLRGNVAYIIASLGRPPAGDPFVEQFRHIGAQVPVVVVVPAAPFVFVPPAIVAVVPPRQYVDSDDLPPPPNEEVKRDDVEGGEAVASAATNEVIGELEKACLATNVEGVADSRKATTTGGSVCRAEAEEDYLVNECFVCTNEIEKDKDYVKCGCAVSHIFCVYCFGFMVRVQSDTANGETFNPSAWAAKHGRVTCCPGTRVAFTDEVIARVCPEQIGVYMASRCKFEAEAASASSRVSTSAEMVRAAKEYASLRFGTEEARDEQRMTQAVKHIQERILVMRCLSCKAPFGEFVGCSSVYCDCGMSFCGLCLDFCDKDSLAVHRHVLTCKVNPNPGESYAFISPEVKLAIAGYRGEAIVAYIGGLNVSYKIKLKISRAIARDAMDTGIPSFFFEEQAVVIDV